MSTILPPENQQSIEMIMRKQLRELTHDDQSWIQTVGWNINLGITGRVHWLLNCYKLSFVFVKWLNFSVAFESFLRTILLKRALELS